MGHEKHERHERGQTVGEASPSRSAELIFAEEALAIQGAVFEVSRAMGPGFLEAVYQECLALEFTARKIPFQAKLPLGLSYKGAALRQTYEPDFVCFGQIIV